MNPDFDSWLERQLRLSLGPERGPRPHPAQARYRTAARSRIPAALAARAAAGGAVAVLAAGGVTVAIAATGSANPIAFGQQVVQAVQQCKEEARSTSAGAPRNIGQCVSAFAREHGEQQRDDHQQTPAGPSPKPGQREGQEGGAQRGNGNGAAGADHGQGQGHQGPPASPGPPAGHGPGDHGRPTPKPAT